MNVDLLANIPRRLVKKWFFVEVSFMKPALLRSLINRIPRIWGFFTSLLGLLLEK